MMGSCVEQLLRALEDLGKTEFEYFKFFLQRSETLDGFPAIPKCKLQEASHTDTVDLMVQTYNGNTLEVAMVVLHKISRNDLVQHLASISSEPKKNVENCMQTLRSNLMGKVKHITSTGNPVDLSEVYTEIHITEEEPVELIREHEVSCIASLSRKPERIIRLENIFHPSLGQEGPRTVMTKGVAGIGKTVLTQRFTLDWAQGKSNQNIQLIFHFTFRELNVQKDAKFSLVRLIHHFFTIEVEKSIFECRKMVFIFDGLDECRLPLDFHNNEVLTCVTHSASLDVLLTNLISGKLLPTAQLWVTTRPAAFSLIPPEFISLMTEVRGFTDSQKEEYFRKRFADEEKASSIISHIKTSRSLYTMCHIPIFCWITATVLERMLKSSQKGELPKTLSEMYIHFLVVQLKAKNVKFHRKFDTDPHWNPDSKQLVLTLGRLAFEHLQKGNLFYESDLTDSGVDLKAACIYSGVFTEFFKEESGLYKDKVFCFVHLSVQEFMAALYVHLTFVKSGDNLLSEHFVCSRALHVVRKTLAEEHFYKSAVKKTVGSPNGHLDLFLRFLLGLSLPANQELLRGLLKPKSSSCSTNGRTVQYIKRKIQESMSAERCINLFHCLNELKDHSLVEEIQHCLSLGHLTAEKLSAFQWSTLVFILLSSDKDLDVFDLKKYSASEEGFLRLMPVVKVSCKVLLMGCKLTERSCEALSSVLSSQSNRLRHLQLSNNDLQNSGVMLLASGLQSPNCILEHLSLSACSLSERSCAFLASAMQINPSHLKDLCLSYNDLQDSGVKLLMAGLQVPKCRLETLQLVRCELSEISCSSLISALRYNPSHLRELDLSENYALQDAGVRLLSVGLLSVQHTLETLRLKSCNLSVRGCAFLAPLLASSNLMELDLSNNNIQDSGVKQLSAGLESPQCRLDSLRLSYCNLSEDSGSSLASAVKSSYLRELDLSRNMLRDFGAKLLCEGLESSDCRLKILRLDSCGLLEGSCSSLAAVLHSGHSHLKELDLSGNRVQDSGATLLCAGLQSPHCKLEILRMKSCSLSEGCCSALAAALQCSSSSLRNVDFSGNRLKDRGLKLLAAGLGNPNCQLGHLQVRCCSLGEKSCSYLISALRTNPSYMETLDLSANHFENLGVKQLAAGLLRIQCNLKTLRLSHCDITDDGCSSLISLLTSNPSLRELDVSSNNLQDMGLKLLSDFMRSEQCNVESLKLK